MLLYSLIYLAAVKADNPRYEQLGRDAVTLDDIKTFRQAGSRCPGHPEYGWTSGVETTTGPLGQGVATSVGMAVARQWLSTTYNRPGFDVFDFNVYALCGDGDMMEGISSEAASLAGHLKLSNLCWIYDSNRITSRARQTSPSPRMSLRASWRMAGPSSASPIRTTPHWSSGPTAISCAPMIGRR